MPSTNSAHAFTNPRERIPDITATGVNVPTETFHTSTVADAVQPLDARRTSDVTAVDFPTITQLTSSTTKLSAILPPLIFGTATFNHQFNPDPYALGPNDIVHAALYHGIRAFDTSPYYGPAEEILGAALHSPLVKTDPVLSHLQRSDYFLLTKCGRIKGDEFDYSPPWIRLSIARSLARLHTDYLDVVYLHDVEFMSPAEVLTGIRTLRAIRAETRAVRHVGICGYPVDVLAALAELVLSETGEPVDIVQSYANYTVQNQRLGGQLARFVGAGVEVVANASPLGMGLCRSQGVPVGTSGGVWHPAPDGLRRKCKEAAEWVGGEGERLENVAVRFAVEGWMQEGSMVGSRGVTPAEAVRMLKSGRQVDVPERAERQGEQKPRLGVNVMGVSALSELQDTMAVYGDALAARSDTDTNTNSRGQQVKDMVEHIRKNILGDEWADYAWESPEPGFVNTREKFGVSEVEMEEFERVYGDAKGQSQVEVMEIFGDSD